MGANCAPWGIGPPPPNGRPPTTSNLPSQTEGTGHYLPGAQGHLSKELRSEKDSWGNDLSQVHSRGVHFFIWSLGEIWFEGRRDGGWGGGLWLAGLRGGRMSHTRTQSASETFRTELRKTLLRTHLGLKISSQQSPPNPQRQSWVTRRLLQVYSNGVNVQILVQDHFNSPQNAALT